MEQINEILQNAINYILTMKPTDFLDIGIIAFLIYKALNFLRRTNSANVLKGIAVIIALLWLSKLLSLNVLSYLLTKTLEIGVLALVVLFQPELRHALERVGKSNIIRLFSPEYFARETETAITQVVLACSQMAQTRIGALIVFEREVRLDEVVKTGTAVGAQPSAELLKNIFYPKTPLHDGAAVIREGKIVSAACVLPNSRNTNISRELGTRHRAGVGMSEASDAIVVVVSEETGSISVAVDGMLKRHLTPETLERLLRNELIPSEDKKSKRKFLARFMRNNDEKKNR